MDSIYIDCEGTAFELDLGKYSVLVIAHTLPKTAQ